MKIYEKHFTGWEIGIPPVKVAGESISRIDIDANGVCTLWHQTRGAALKKTWATVFLSDRTDERFHGCRINISPVATAADLSAREAIDKRDKKIFFITLTGDFREKKPRS